MEYVSRVLDLAPLLAQRTVLLFGPRQTGKSSYLRRELAGRIALTYDLLDRGLLLRLMADPTLLRQEIGQRGLRDCVVCVDEVQKLPELLDEVQLLMEERGIRFLLTGSSARKLKRSGTNLLGGRGRDRRMHPFVYPELRRRGFDLERAMNHGLVPSHYLTDEPDEDLAAYVGRYLTEEIAAEGLSRNLPAFSRFLQVAATTNAQLLNFAGVGSDAQVARQTVQQWYRVLTDTLLGFELAPFTETVKRKAIGTPKFYFFDPGVVRALRALPRIGPSSHEYGEFFEHLVFLELRAWIDYRRPLTSLHYWRARSGYEVDFILGGEVAVETKATTRVAEKHLRGLRALQEERRLRRYLLVCRESRPRRIDGIEILPYTEFLDALWDAGL